MKTRALLAIFIGLFINAHARTWTDVRGRKIEAELISQDETSVVLQLTGGGKPVPVPLANLSEADHEFLRAKAAEANAPAAATGKYAAQWTGSFEKGDFGGKLPFLLRVPKELKNGGKYGTWSALVMEPKLFAAAIPICGGGDAASVRKFDKVPIWAFHNDGEPTVTVEGSRSMIAALKKAGGDPKYTEHQSTQHDAWLAPTKTWTLGVAPQPEGETMTQAAPT